MLTVYSLLRRFGSETKLLAGPNMFFMVGVGLYLSTDFPGLALGFRFDDAIQKISKSHATGIYN